MKQLSLEDISHELKLSKATISYVLNGRGDEKRISKKTQDRIRKYTKEHNYKVNQVARALSLGKSNMIGILVPNISDTFFARIARRIEKKAEHFNYNVIFASTGEDGKKESKLIRSMLDRQVDGLIIVSCEKNSEDILLLKKRNFPFVLVDRYYPDIETNYVIMNNAASIFTAVEHLISSGRKRIGLITLSDKLEPLHQRYNSYINVMGKHNLPVEDGFVHKLHYNCVEQEMEEAIQKIIKPSVNLDGIVFATHFLAAAGVRELKRLNIRVPNHIAMVSFGQNSDFDLVEPPITSLKLPSDAIGDKAVEILLRKMDREDSDYEKICINTELLIRKSCGEV